jgi:acyl dehydratase
MACLGQVLTGWVAQSAIRSYSARFVAPTHVGDALTCTGRIVAKSEGEAEDTVRIQLHAIDQFGEIKVRGEALVQLGT